MAHWLRTWIRQACTVNSLARWRHWFCSVDWVMGCALWWSYIMRVGWATQVSVCSSLIAWSGRLEAGLVNEQGYELVSLLGSSGTTSSKSSKAFLTVLVQANRGCLKFPGWPGPPALLCRISALAAWLTAQVFIIYVTFQVFWPGFPVGQGWELHSAVSGAVLSFPDSRANSKQHPRFSP